VRGIAVNCRKAFRKAKRGQALIESTISIILFTMLLATMVSFCVYLYMQQAIVTVAREGARQASLTDDLANNTDSVEQYVKDEVRSLTGQNFDNGTGSIMVDGPLPSTSNPNINVVTVSIDYSIPNPIPIGSFMTALGGDGTAFNSIPVAASATMRYED
jgi:hypothetical protein